MWNDLWVNHKGKTAGAIGGIFFGIIYLFFGLWDMLVFALIAGIGFYIGNRKDQGEDLLPLHYVYNWLSSRKRRLK
jgi:uncharacterized membrane protein